MRSNAIENQFNSKVKSNCNCCIKYESVTVDTFASSTKPSICTRIKKKNSITQLANPFSFERHPVKAMKIQLSKLIVTVKSVTVKIHSNGHTK